MNATLHTGTKYTVENADGSQSEVRTLTVETQAKVLALDANLHLYQLADGTVIFVNPADDK